MSPSLQWLLIIGTLIFCCIILIMLRRKSLNLKYSMVWFFFSAVLLLIAAFPQLVYCLAKWVGVMVPSNIVFVLEAVFVLIVLLSLTAIVSSQNEKIVKLVQSIALLEKRVRDLEQQKERQE